MVSNIEPKQSTWRKGWPAFRQSISRLATDLLFPPVCRLCDVPIGSGLDFCSPCEQKLTFTESLMNDACRRCGRPKTYVKRGEENALPELQSGSPGCSHCAKETFLFDEVIALWTYQADVCDAVVAAKYGHQAALGDALGRKLGGKVGAILGTDIPDVVVGMPLHWTRRMVRGGNGNRAIAHAVSKTLSDQSKHSIGRTAPLVGVLRTTRKIEKQAWLDDEARRRNVKDAFDLARGYGIVDRSHQVSGKHILLVDDVLTTGATANEVTKVLSAAGAARVTLAVVARAIWD